MRVFTFLFCTVIFASVPNSLLSQNAKIHIEENKSITVDEVFDLIMNQTDYKFFYEEGMFKDFPKVQLKKGVVKANKLLSRSISTGNLDITIAEGNVVLIKEKPKNPIKRVQYIVSGKVTDVEGQPLPGSSVVEKGTTNGTQTDFDGNFTLNTADDNAVLVISYIGFAAQEVSVKNQIEITVVLKEDAAGLDEVVVIGYGKVRREALSGAVGVLNNEVLEDLPLTNSISGLQGRLAGTVITRTNGRPGEEGLNIRVRGASTVNGNNAPLIIVDGIPGSLSDLNPNDIETTTVLKDASAAIYGARASNGVILVTTKKGKSGKPKININSSYSVKRRADFFEQLSSYQIATMNREARDNAGGGGEFSLTDAQIEAMRNETGEPIEIGYGTVYAKTWDYSDLAFQDGSQQNIDANISGSTDKLSYRTSFGFIKEDGLLKQGSDDNQRLNSRVNISYKPLDRLNIDTRLAISRQRTRSPNQSGLGQILRIFPFMTPYTAADPTKYAITQGFRSPMQRHEQGGTNTSLDTRIEANAKVDYELLDNFTATGQVGSNLRFREFNNFTRTITTWDELTGESAGTSNDPNTGFEGFGKEVYATLIGYLNYNNTFAGAHNLSVTAGASHEQFEESGFWAQRRGFPSNDFFSLNLGDSEAQTNGVLNDATWTIRSLFGRSSYVLNDKYIFDFNMRYDGSSRFSKDTRWGLFWGVSGAWQLGREKFIEDLNIFDALKLRFSYAETGNQDGIGLYDYIGTVTINGEYPFGNGARIAGANVGNLVDPTRTWETLKTENVGLDFSILNNNLSASFDYFIKKNEDMLVPVNVPSLLGSPAPSGNNGSLETKGWELSLNWQEDIGEHFSYFVNVNVGDAKNVVTNFGGQDTYNVGRVGVREGYAIDTYHGWVFDGIIQNQEELDAYSGLEGVPSNIGIGDARYKDVNNDGVISVFGEDGENGDVVPLGNPTPRYNYGINLGFNYKNVEFSAFLQGVGKKDIFLDGDWSAPWFHPWHKPDSRFWNTTWSPDRTNAKYPRLSHSSIRGWNYNKSTNTLLDASYIRLKNLTVGYNLPKSVIDKLGLAKLKLYATGLDLWEKHNLGGGFDPESLTATQTVPQAYPFSRLYSFGVSITF
ncbi:SusC/RagA family TonB-linked outer membrane protein [Maribacter ulvicola]|uniref:TonB-linked outer membrane protein, SusC/RagA family n=1 Tax=Maribacter ulvicola TaxID=228959 RepID=A0A1N6X893_9FLAO|nr:TonB-dependent receptor [Maribacter ulvicola]SIQ98490.1 TonB-linked outer membrane protein, SusC/RagA family [Maribacter ulvicola]